MLRKLGEKYGRIAKKLRISVTDRCNMRCIYCMPTNNADWLDDSQVLSFNEIVRLASIFADLGIEKIRITGGEPLVRPSLENLINSISMIPGMKGVNKVIRSINNANDAGLDVKLNTVVIRGWNDDEIVDFALFARDNGFTVRFIEFMPLEGTGIWKHDLGFSKKEMIERINWNLGEIVKLHNSDNQPEPAMLYSLVDGKGSMGFSPSITEPFCGNCDRVRITSDGRLLTCLFENPGHDLKGFLRS